MKFSFLVLFVWFTYDVIAQVTDIERNTKAFADSCFLPGVQLLDTRTSSEFNSGHLDKAMLADWNQRSEFERRVAFLDKNQPVFVYCLMGGRSKAAATWMREHGFTHVVELAGGVNAWKAAGLTVVNQSAARQLTAAEYHAYINTHSLMLVDFGASWCPPCIKMKPVVDSLRKVYGDKLQIWEIDAGIHTDLLKSMKIEPIPVFIIYKNGKEIWRKAGVVDFADFKEVLN